MRNIPPLNSLRAFDAVARNGSLSKAAMELKVSSSAVSQQISSLENWMEVRLLQRSSNKTSLTSVGTQFAGQINNIFDHLEDNVSKTRKTHDRNEIRISVLPSLATRWLMNRLPNYSSIHPNSRVMVEASFNVVNFDQEEFSLAIRSGMGSYLGCHTIKLFDEYIMPVCSPEYWQQHKVSLVDIGKCVLLADHSTGPQDSNLNWNSWMHRSNLKPSFPLEPSQQFSDSNLTIQAAVNGEGFMLGRTVLIADEIKRGNLIAPFETKQVSDWAYFLVYPSTQHPPRNPLRAFIQWLQDEAKNTIGIVED